MTSPESSAAPSLPNELFILHAEAEADLSFVHNVLLPALPVAADRVALSSELPPGGVAVEELERAIATSRVTFLLLSPALLADPRLCFGELLASDLHIEGKRNLVPVLIADCKVPRHLKALVAVDLHNPRGLKRNLQRLQRLFSAPAAPAAPAPPAEPAAPAAATLPRPPRPHHLPSPEPCSASPPPPDSFSARLRRTRSSVIAMLGLLLIASTALLFEPPPRPPPAAPPSKSLAQRRADAAMKLERGQHREALRLARKLLEEGPDPELAQICLRALCALGRPQEARLYLGQLPEARRAHLAGSCPGTAAP